MSRISWSVPVTILAFTLILLVLPAAKPPVLHADPISPPDVPTTTLQAPAGSKLFLVVHAIGTQNYTCSGGVWGPATPQADLFAANGRQVGTHFAGPTWQYQDGSSVRGARDVGVIVDQTAIPWLLLHKVTSSAGPDGDRLAPTTYIQRVHTVGGLPPAGGCTDGATASVPYEADYYFYRSGTDPN